MAKCTLDDLTPSLRCTSVVLNSVQELDINGDQTGNFDYGSYKVEMHAELYDTVDEHDEGIADYLISQNVQNYVDYYVVYSRDRAVKDFFDFLTSHQSGYREILGQSAEYGFSEEHKSMLFHETILGTKVGTQLQSRITAAVAVSAGQFFNTINSMSYRDLATTNPFNSSTQATEHTAWVYFKDAADAILSNFQLFLSPDTQFMVTSAFTGRFMRHMMYMAYSLFSGGGGVKLGTTMHVLSLSNSDIVQKQDEDGNMYYTLPLGTLYQNNSVNVEDCYVYTFCVYDLSKHLEDLGSTNWVFPAEPGVEKYTYSIVNETAILSGKRPASPIVIDQRLQERIGEIIRSDYIGIYENSIDQISLLSSEFTVGNSGIVSRLFSSYQLQETGVSGDEYSPSTQNYFYINFGKLFKRKSKLNFMYHQAEENMNLANFIETNINSIVKDLYITRIRIDAEEEPKRILQGNTQITRMDSIVDNSFMYTFQDLELANLTDGEYVYRIDFSIQDIMYRLIRVAQVQIRRAMAILDEAIRYIHNNPQHYDELRDSISEQGRLFLQGHFDANNSTSTFSIGALAADILMELFSGFKINEVGVGVFVEEVVSNIELAALYEAEVMDVLDAGGVIYQNTNSMDYPLATNIEDIFAPDTFSNLDKISRRMIENYRRILQDILTASSKFAGSSVSVQEENYVSATYAGGTTLREFFDFSKTWNQDVVRAGIEHRLMCDMTYRHFNNLQSGAYTLSQMDSEFRFETQKHTGTLSTSVWNSDPNLQPINHLAPWAIGRKKINYRDLEDETDLLSKIGLIEASVSNTNKKVGHMGQQITSRLYEQWAGDDQYDTTVEELKNDSGFFESLLHDLGTTVTNFNAESIDTNVVVERAVRESVFGLDFGENSPSSKFTLAEATPEALEEALEERNEIREALFLEKQKLEHLVMNCLVDVNGHHLLDRNDFTQGTPRSMKFRRYDVYEIINNVVNEGKPYPRLNHRLLLDYYRNSHSSTNSVNPITVLSSRFVADNTFLVFYLSGFDENMTPIWVELLRSDMSTVLSEASARNQNRVLCKLERFSVTSRFTNIGIGSSSQLEITGKYFYLIA